LLTVNYKGAEPPPDNLQDDAQALAEGSYGHDGVFHANVLQAKCASKYAPAQPGQQPGMQPATKPAATRITVPRCGQAPAAANSPAAPTAGKLRRMNAPASEAASSTACARLDQVSKLFGAFAALPSGFGGV